MSAPIQGFAEHTIWHEIIMFQLCYEGRSWPLILASLPLRLLSSLPDLSGDLGNHSKTLWTRPLCLYHSSGVFSTDKKLFMISIPPNNDFSYLGCCNLMTVIICCCSGKMKVAENAASRHLSHTKNLKALMNFNEKEKTCGDLILFSELKEKQNEPQRHWVWGDGRATTTIAKTPL